MKSLKEIAIFLLVPYPLAIFGAFVSSSFMTSLSEGRISEWHASAFGEAEAPPGYLVCGLIILLVQFFLGSVPIFFLRMFNSGLVGYLVSGLVVASLSAGVMIRGGASKEFNLFAGILFFLIILGYYFASRVSDHPPASS